LRVYDSGSQRPSSLQAGSFKCSSLQPGATADRLYCAYYNSLSRLTVDNTGVSLVDSFPLPTGGRTAHYMQMLFNRGRIYTTTGLVIDPEAKVVIDSLPVQGPVAVVGDRVYWLDPSFTSTTEPRLALRSFDVSTLKPVSTRLIKVASDMAWLIREVSTELTRLVPCGQGRLAFRAGQQIYIVHPDQAEPPAPSIERVVPIYSSVPVVQPSSWISIYGRNLANGTAIWNNDFPTSLGGVSVSIDGKPAYLWYVSGEQINLQVPDDAKRGIVPVVVTTPNGSASSNVVLSEFGPSLNLFDQKYVAAVIPTPDGSGVYGGGTYDLLGPADRFSFKTRPVKPGEVLQLYGVGFGPTNPAVEAGKAFIGAARATSNVTFTVGGVPATLQFAGLTAAGLYQFNIVIPKIGSGDHIVQASVNSVNPVTAPVAYITVQ
ncbi:MAG: hypothetical protein LLG20_25700, partial [Acidobacteriales bacterium]|nr:hypothetical protein [Terriglobales bacterium]